MVETATERDDISDDLLFSRMWEHGIAIVEVDADQVLVNFHNVGTGFNAVEQSYYDKPDEFLAMVRLYSFTIKDGEINQIK